MFRFELVSILKKASEGFSFEQVIVLEASEYFRFKLVCVEG